jgi:hypothetical protein
MKAVPEAAIDGSPLLFLGLACRHIAASKSQ